MILGYFDQSQRALLATLTTLTNHPDYQDHHDHPEHPDSDLDQQNWLKLWYQGTFALLRYFNVRKRKWFHRSHTWKVVIWTDSGYHPVGTISLRLLIFWKLPKHLVGSFKAAIMDHRQGDICQVARNQYLSVASTIKHRKGRLYITRCPPLSLATPVSINNDCHHRHHSCLQG